MLTLKSLGKSWIHTIKKILQRFEELLRAVITPSAMHQLVSQCMNSGTTVQFSALPQA